MDPISLSIIVLAHWLLNQPVVPGEDSYLVFTVFNPTQAYYFNMTITINSSLIKPVYYVNSTSNYCEIPVVPPEGNSSCVVYVEVDPSASLGIYTVPITVNYTEVNVTVTERPMIGYESISVPVTTLVTTTLQNGVPVVTGVKTETFTISIPTVLGATPSVSTSKSSVSVSTNVMVPVLGYVGFSAMAFFGTPNDVVQPLPGNYLPLTIYVTNYGNTPVTNVTVTLESLPDGMYAVNNTAHLPGLLPGEPTPVTFYVYVPNYIPQGNYTLVLGIDYFGGVDTVVDAPLIVSQRPTVYVQSVATNPPEVFEGYSMAELVLSIINVGSGVAYNASLYVTSSAGNISLVSMPIILGAIPTGQPIQLTVPISAPGVAGNYSVYITVDFDGGSSSRVYTLYVRPKADIIVTGVTYPQPPSLSLNDLWALFSSITNPGLSPGASKVPITITLENVGDVEAQNVVVHMSTSQVIQPHVSSNNPLSALTASEVFIGDLKPGQPINVTFLVDVDSNAPPGTYPLVLTLVWNQTGSLYPLTESITTYVTIKPAPNVLLLIVVVLIIVVIVIGAVAAIRRRRMGGNNTVVRNAHSPAPGRLVDYTVGYYTCEGDGECYEVELV
ncbi:COG1361 S-layer family protein [Vulcanisaeta thermophila]|uniref:COG1361 S-layer family protein n=1 Tax=Vulcanisaeta thermophila TaxID=867917 RepID=UPI000852945E|nr:NEW3 domain-containing protein [Vulcanisaeta thermophila]